MTIVEQRRGRPIGWLLALAATVAVALLVRCWFGHSPDDIEVFVRAGAAFTSGESPYHSGGLPFIYPPIAAVLFAPLAAGPSLLAGLIWTAFSSAACLLLVRWAGVLSPLTAGLVAVVAVALAAPFFETIRIGQVGVILAAVIVLDDVVGRTQPRWAGVLTGLATAVKLTPGLFVLADACRRDWRRALVAAVAITALMAAGVALMPGASLEFAQLVTEVGGDSATVHMSNQSVWAATTRLLGEGAAATGAALVISLAVVAMAMLAALRSTDRSTALCVVGMATLVASPISWTHHWVWVLPVGILAYRKAFAPAARWLGLIVAGWVAVAPYRVFQAPGKVDYSIGEALIGAVSALLALGFVAAGVVGERAALADGSRPGAKAQM
ncbi:glycosyltransferase 87 family protein [Parenemella sanctibonifatiensis]|uniref:glycosyltransferase 87 family protein n=1 Tax=Parenemella sanctibonifatiensis TaxID=2016505 RepID=UPI0015C6401C|nr:glycosyltransferase 87 family protein [Parenemella sanctibonifatiensis]